MTQFVAFDRNVEVNGTTILSVVAGLGETAIPILAAHGLGNLQPDEWYPQQAWLDAFKKIATGTVNSMFDLVGIGMAIPENAIFPAEIDSIVSALRSIDVAYHMNHRGGEIGHYQSTIVSLNQVDLLCQNPYPCDFDYGIVYSMARRFCPDGMRISVQHDDKTPCRKKGAESCTYHVSWKPA